MIENFYKKLTNLTDLKPWKKTDYIFRKLCEYAISVEEDLEINEKVLKINEICASAEYEMEKFWSEKIQNSETPEQKLEDFIYFKNYKKLTKLEFSNFLWIDEVKNKKILFIWSGPLPLTAIILAKYYKMDCTLVDISEEAIELSKNLIKKLNLEEYFTFINSDILDFKTNESFDLVYWASLIFWNKKQEEILKNISNLNFSKLLVRTSQNYRQLLYKKVETNFLKKYFQIELEVNPKNEIINSFIILSKK